MDTFRRHHMKFREHFKICCVQHSLPTSHLAGLVRSRAGLLSTSAVRQDCQGRHHVLAAFIGWSVSGTRRCPSNHGQRRKWSATRSRLRPVPCAKSRESEGRMTGKLHVLKRTSCVSICFVLVSRRSSFVQNRLSTAGPDCHVSAELGFIFARERRRSG